MAVFCRLMTQIMYIQPYPILQIIWYICLMLLESDENYSSYHLKTNWSQRLIIMKRVTTHDTQTWEFDKRRTLRHMPCYGILFNKIWSLWLKNWLQECLQKSHDRPEWGLGRTYQTETRRIWYFWINEQPHRAPMSIVLIPVWGRQTHCGHFHNGSFQKPVDLEPVINVGPAICDSFIFHLKF